MLSDRSEEINQYLKNASISPVDIKKKAFDKWAGQGLNPSKLDLYGDQKKVLTMCLVEVLKHNCRISNSNIVRNSNEFLSKCEEETSVDWIGESRSRIPPQKFEISY